MNKENLLTSILLISCTSIGGGMLALPCATANNGFFLSSISFIVCWAFMTISSFFMLEITLWFKTNINIMTIINQILGYKCKIFVSIIYISLLYSLISAYIFAYHTWLENLLLIYLDQISIRLICVTLFIFLNIKLILNKKTSINKINYILSLGFFIIYIILLYICIPYINISSIKILNTLDFYKNISLIITSFGFCIIIPTLVTYLKKNNKELFYSIIIGSLIPLFIYILWEFTIIGLFPSDGKNNLIELNLKEKNFDIMFMYFLENILYLKFASKIIILFSVLAILTSTIGVTLSLNDFISDTLQIKTIKKKKFTILFFTVFPPIICSTYFTLGFTSILKISGMLVSILLGILPITMTWYGRYKLNIKSKFIVFGGKPLLLLTCLFFCLIIGYDLHTLII